MVAEIGGDDNMQLKLFITSQRALYKCVMLSMYRKVLCILVKKSSCFKVDVTNGYLYPSLQYE